MADILIVEDRADWQEHLADMLAPYRLHIAGSRREAEAKLADHTFDLAVVDIVLAENQPDNREGLSVIMKLCESQPRLPLMVVTSFLTEDVRASLKQICPQAPIFFKGTLQPDELLNTVRRLLGQPALHRADSPALAPAMPTPPPEARRNRPRVLLVEDDLRWQQEIAEILAEAGYFWRIAADPDEARRELAHPLDFHLVILDLKLQTFQVPVRSSRGWLLLDELIETAPRTKILILSGVAEPGDVAELLTRYPLLGFIEKQRCTPQQIIEAVEQASRKPQLRIQSLGQFRLWLDDQPVESWKRLQAETVLKFLLARRTGDGYLVMADELIAYFWPDSDLKRGRKKLDPVLSVVRHTLEPGLKGGDSTFLVRQGEGYYFNLDERVAWDVADFRRHLQRGQQLAQQQDWAKAVAELKQGQTLYKGDFLAENLYDDWAMEARETIIKEYRDLLLVLADAHAALEQYPQAIKTCRAALPRDEWFDRFEDIYRRLICFHYRNGNKGQALKTYQIYLEEFRELFGEEPDPATRQLGQAIANDQPISEI